MNFQFTLKGCVFSRTCCRSTSIYQVWEHWDCQSPRREFLILKLFFKKVVRSSIKKSHFLSELPQNTQITMVGSHQPRSWLLQMRHFTLFYTRVLPSIFLDIVSAFARTITQFLLSWWLTAAHMPQLLFPSVSHNIKDIDGNLNEKKSVWLYMAVLWDMLYQWISLTFTVFFFTPLLKIHCNWEECDIKGNSAHSTLHDAQNWVMSTCLQKMSREKYLSNGYLE